jgi:hypothetical protein
MWWVASQKTGASAIGLQQVLGLGSYETAWTWLHKLRRAIVRPGGDRLTGRVEVDEAFIGGVEEGIRGRQPEKQALREPTWTTPWTSSLSYSTGARPAIAGSCSTDWCSRRSPSTQRRTRRWSGTHGREGTVGGTTRYRGDLSQRDTPIGVTSSPSRTLSAAASLRAWTRNRRQGPRPSFEPSGISVGEDVAKDRLPAATPRGSMARAERRKMCLDRTLAQLSAPPSRPPTPQGAARAGGLTSHPDPCDPRRFRKDPSF